LNLLDIVLGLIIIASVVSSFRAGFSREIIGLVSVFLAAVCGLWFYGLVAAYLLPYVSSQQVANFGGFALIFLGVMVCGALLGMIVGRFLQTVGLSWFDRLLGAAFGFVRAILICVVLVMALVAFSPGHEGGGPPATVVSSRLAPHVIEASRFLVAAAPHEMKDGFRSHYDQVRRAWDHALGKERSAREM
jgi:membrane protein required for colicin V production